MSPTGRIAKLLGFTSMEAVTFCEQVRLLSGLGRKLHYQEILNQLPQERSPHIGAAALAKVIAQRKPVEENNTAQPTKPALKKTPKSAQPVTKEKLSIFERHELAASQPDSEPFVPSHMPKGVKPYSYLDYQRVTINYLHENLNSKKFSFRVSDKEKAFVKGECAFPNTALPRHAGKRNKQNKELQKANLQSKKTDPDINSKPNFDSTKEYLSSSEKTAPLAVEPGDYGLYKCGECGAYVIGFAKKGHKHPGKVVEFNKVGG